VVQLGRILSIAGRQLLQVLERRLYGGISANLAESRPLQQPGPSEVQQPVTDQIRLTVRQQDLPRFPVVEG
jgi:hypothetical protein